MDYDDDDYDQYRQYEDEMYKDQSEESEASDEVDSELEDTMLGHIHYSTNVYKKIGTGATSVDNQETDSSNEDEDSEGSSGHLAEANTPAEDYFKSTKQGAEEDSDTEQRSSKSSLPNRTSAIQVLDDGEDDEEEESKYKVERKRDIQMNSSVANTQGGQNGKSVSKANGTGSGSDSDMDLSESDGEDDSRQESAVVLDNEEDTVSDGDDAQFGVDREGLDEHFLDLTKTVSGGQEDDNDYDPDAELGHLDDKKFQDCTERNTYGNRCHKCGSHSHATEDCPTVWRVYVLSSESTPNDVVQYCYNCASLGHFGDGCPKRRPMYARGDSAFNDQNTTSSSANNNYSSSRSGQSSSSHTRLSSSTSVSIRGDKKDRYRDRDADRGSERDYHRSRDYDRDHDRDRDRGSGRDRDRHRDYDRDYGRSSHHDHRSHESSGRYDYDRRDRSREREREREKGRERDRERERERDRDRRHKRSSSSTPTTAAGGSGSASSTLTNRLPASLPPKPKPRPSPSSRQENPALVPTTATGHSPSSSKPSSPASALLGSHDRPIDLSSPTSSPAARASALPSRSSLSTSSASRLHSSLPPKPSGYGGSSNGGSNGNNSNRPSISNRSSFADLNAFPRGGGRDPHGGGGTPGSSGGAGAAGGAQPGPMYTGGYSRNRK
ncbi:hypothetical protein BGZ96_004181 [Linnemannia gamsii]|uniref:CCHC-type domain-containing protein n=1 Tax=Linnemannia gamsii TaxID=64522 RepID=A0ABQ7K5Y8_9FUNG|nr:hypothetical protein BGZ96_004181 [Linnemannia gamsii]